LIRQRVYGVALGYEDLNDHDALRHDLALQTFVGKDVTLASSPTLCRFENGVTDADLFRLSRVFVDTFIGSYRKAPKEIVLDFDSTDDAVHGNQEGRFFHGYYDQYCFLPLYVFCGNHLLCAYLRPGNTGDAKHALGILALLVRRIRLSWPKTRIVFRGDAGFCRWKLMRWCDRRGIGYIIGLRKNARLLDQSGFYLDAAREKFLRTGQKQTHFHEISYAARTWDRPRRVIVKAEHMAKGSNPRFVVTNMKGNPSALYARYCARGDMENRIKEQQLYLFADRTSASRWFPNQLRILFSGLAYTLLLAIRQIGLAGTELSNARCDTIRLKLFKVGACVIRNTRRVHLMLSASYPYKELFELAAIRLRPG
jgi:hypothetical protein